MSDAETSSLIDDVILTLCASCDPGKTASPTDVAKSFAEREGIESSAWRTRLGAVKRAATRLAEAGQIDVYRKGRRIEPREVKGVYRLGPRL